MPTPEEQLAAIKRPDELTRLQAENARLWLIVDACAAECPPDDSLEVNERVALLRAFRDAACHVVIEHGVVPGLDDACRCDDCRDIAVSMADAGYLDRIKDRWWEAAQAAKENPMPTATEQRWAVLAKHDGESFLAGRYCWSYGSRHETAIPTFRTRQTARNAIRLLTSYRRGSVPVRVQVTTATIDVKENPDA